MAIVAAAAFAVALLALPASDAPPASVVVSIEPGRPEPDREVDDPVGVRSWAVEIRISAHTDAPCERLSLAYRYRVLFNRTLVQRFAHSGAEEAQPGASSHSLLISAPNAIAGSVVGVRAVAECSNAVAPTARSVATAAVRIPFASCDEGALRVLRLRGRAAHEDLSVANRRRPLRRGDAMVGVHTAWVGRRGRVVFGAPECNGYRVSAWNGALLIVGSYNRRGRGDFTGLERGSVRMTTDVRGGGVSASAASASPLRQHASQPVTFEVHARERGAWATNRVRVLRGAVRIVAGAPLAPFTLAAGREVRIRCRARLFRACTREAVPR